MIDLHERVGDTMNLIGTGWLVRGDRMGIVVAPATGIEEPFAALRRTEEDLMGTANDFAVAKERTDLEAPVSMSAGNEEAPR